MSRREPSFPLSSNDPTPSEVTALVNAHNQQLSATLANLRQSLTPDVNLMTYDVNTLFDNVLANPSTFGLTNTTAPCLFALSCLFDATGQTQQQYLFWDGIHPTTKGHQIIARGALLSLQQQQSVPEPNSIVGLVAFGVLAMGTARIRKTPNKPQS